MAASEPVLSPVELTRRRRAWAGWVRLGRLERGGLVVLALTTAVALLAPLLAPYPPTTALPAGSFAAPGTHGLLLGSDELARDLFSRVLYGIRASWLSALAVIASGVLIGGLIGTVAGVAGGWLVRGEVRAQAVRSHVDAARLAGVGRTRLAFRHLLPGAFPAVLVTASLDVGSLVLILAGLSFIGLGSPPPAPELGSMAARGMPYLFGHPWIPLAPAIAVFLLAFAANLAGDGLRDLLEDH